MCLCGMPMGEGFRCVCMVHQWGRGSGVSVWYTSGGRVLVCLCGTLGMFVWYTSGGEAQNQACPCGTPVEEVLYTGNA